MCNDSLIRRFAGVFVLLSVGLGYWVHPLAAYNDAAVWTSDPKIAIFRDSMNNRFWNAKIMRRLSFSHTGIDPNVVISS